MAGERTYVQHRRAAALDIDATGFGLGPDKRRSCPRSAAKSCCASSGSLRRSAHSVATRWRRAASAPAPPPSAPRTSRRCVASSAIAAAQGSPGTVGSAVGVLGTLARST